MLASVLNNRYLSYMKMNAGPLGSEIELNDANILLDPARPPMDADLVELLQSGLTYGLNGVYWSIGVLAILTFALTCWLPRLDPSTLSTSRTSSEQN